MGFGKVQIIARLPERLVGGDPKTAAPALIVTPEIDHGKGRMGAAVIWIELNCPLEIGDRLLVVLRRRALIVLPALQEAVVSCRHRGVMLA